MPFKDPEDKRRYQQSYFGDYYKERGEAIKANVRARKRALREWFNDFKRTLICKHCGLKGADNPWAMEFHHRDPENKRDLVSYMVAQGYSKTRILDEADKCDVTCANCHRMTHYKDYQEKGQSVFQEAGSRPPRTEDTYTSKRQRRSRKKYREKRRQLREHDKNQEASDLDSGQ